MTGAITTIAEGEGAVVAEQEQEEEAIEGDLAAEIFEGLTA
jgi:hypothetical protein